MFPGIKSDFSEGFITTWEKTICLSESKKASKQERMLFNLHRMIKMFKKYKNMLSRRKC